MGGGEEVDVNVVPKDYWCVVRRLVRSLLGLGGSWLFCDIIMDPLTIVPVSNRRNLYNSLVYRRDYTL